MFPTIINIQSSDWITDRGWSCSCVCVCAHTACSPACGGPCGLEWSDCISGRAHYSACTLPNTLNIYHTEAERCCKCGVLVTISSKHPPNEVQMWFPNGTEVRNSRMHTRTHARTQNNCGLFMSCLVLIITRWESKAIADRLTRWICFNLPWVIGLQFSLLTFLAQKSTIC